MDRSPSVLPAEGFLCLFPVDSCCYCYCCYIKVAEVVEVLAVEEEGNRGRGDCEDGGGGDGCYI